jgi:hypothetical protein
VAHGLRDLRIGTARAAGNLHVDVVGDIQHAWDAVGCGLRRELLGVARHGAGEGDDALVNFHTDLGVSHARIPAEFAQHFLMDVFVTLPHHDQSSFTRARPLWLRDVRILL